jgi:uncharacterized membrane protein
MEIDVMQYLPPVQQAHAIAAHLPVALSALGVVAVAAAIIIPTNRHTLRWAVVGMYILLAATAVLSVETGESARAQVSGALPKPIWETIDRHEDMAERVWMLSLATALFMAVSVPARGGLRTSMNAVTMLASLATVGWVGYVGHLGGDLVYSHGIGIPPDRIVEWRINPPAGGATTVASVPATQRTDLIPIRDIDMTEAAAVSYTNDIVPIFEEVCYSCHSPEEKIDAELDMTTVEKLLIGGEKYGSCIVPGKPDESTIVKYVRGELQPQMPEDDMPLTREEVHLLRLWIAAGAIDDSKVEEPPAPLEE